MTPAAANPAMALRTDHLAQLTTGYQISACLYAAAYLNIADLLASGPRSVEDLASETQTNADRLYRVMRVLVSVDVFLEPQPRTFALSPTAELLRSDIPESRRGFVLFSAMPFVTHVNSHLLHSVQTGQPSVEHLYGKPAFECLTTMPEVAFAFNEAMTSISASLAPAVLDAYSLDGIGTLMDVAGGHGYFICQALDRYPNMKGILLDLPSVVEGARCAICERNMDHRCTPVAGNFFENIPSGADAYFMQHILHDWDDEHCMTILRNVKQALAGRPNGRLIAVDVVLPEDSKPHPGKLLDLMMMVLPGGRERSEIEWRALFDKAGLTIKRIVPTAAPDSVIEAVLTR
ncbi:MAG TPA: methyltransferase [Candidatus Saccharimonadales bacterium]|nr:methyltransferase [Candidatus Saccharimonadales bacterium]